MLEKDFLVKITNRDNGSVGYSIPERNIKRTFESGESKDITMEELRQLSWTPGGKKLLEDYFILDNKDAIKELLSEVEPEYYYTKEDVEDLLLNKSVDALIDCLNFAPDGTKNLVKELAVKLKINDINKRKAIKNITKFDVSKAIEINEETESNKQEEKTQRRVPVSTEKTVVRRTAIK